MNKNILISIKSGKKLDLNEINQLNIARKREWNIPPMEEKQLHNTFFLLKNQNKILAQGQLLPINGVIFDNEIFDIYGIGGIIANEKGKGYGRELMAIIKQYLIDNIKSGVGFTGVPGFYEKCGYKSDKDSLKRFVCVADGKEIANTSDEYIVYFNSADRFMEKVLTNPEEKVFLPRTPDW